MAFHFEWGEGFNKRCIVNFFKYSESHKNMVKRGNLINGINSFDFGFVCDLKLCISSFVYGARIVL